MVREMHLRRFAPVVPPCRLIQMVWLIEPRQRASEADMLNALPAKLQREGEGDDRHALFANPAGTRFIWESHTEATTITAITGIDNDDDYRTLVRWMENWPGAVVRATKIFVETDEDAAAKRYPEMGFIEHDIVTCYVRGGVRLWSDFAIHEGYGRLLIAANGVAPEPLGRVIQKIQELGNYRNLTLMGLPLVQQHSPELDGLERNLSNYMQSFGEAADRDEETQLADITDLSAELARIRVETGFRLSATQAYGQIAVDRLSSLDVEPITGCLSLTDFTERRLLPAMRTCASFDKRLDALAERADSVVALLNTRIDTRIKAQNLELLRSMENSIGLQMRLQHLVEALSAVAATYYAVGLLAYLLKGAQALPAWYSLDVAIALLIFPVAAVILLFVRRQRVRILEKDKSVDRQRGNGKPQQSVERDK